MNKGFSSKKQSFSVSSSSERVKRNIYEEYLGATDAGGAFAALTFVFAPLVVSCERKTSTEHKSKINKIKQNLNESQ